VLAAIKPVDGMKRAALLTKAPRHVIYHDHIGSVVILAYSKALEVAFVVA
jgi:hypothetical protein